MRSPGNQALRIAVAFAVFLLLTALLPSLAAPQAAADAASGGGLHRIAGARQASVAAEEGGEEPEEEVEEEGGEGEEEEGEQEAEGAEAREREEEQEEEEEGHGHRSHSRSNRPGRVSHRSGGHRQTARVSALAITPAGRGALQRHHPPAAAISFSFHLSAPAKVRVTVATQTNTHGRVQWHTLASFELTARKGSNTASLRGHRLVKGLDRIAVSAADASRNEVSFHVR